MDTIPQLDWDKVYLESAYTIRALSEVSDVDECSVRKYLTCDRIPRGKNLKKMETAMFKIQKKPRLQFHPSYGYATPEQIDRLKTVGVGAEMDALLKEIEKQTKSRGKYVL